MLAKNHAALRFQHAPHFAQRLHHIRNRAQGIGDKHGVGCFGLERIVSLGRSRNSISSGDAARRSAARRAFPGTAPAPTDASPSRRRRTANCVPPQTRLQYAPSGAARLCALIRIGLAPSRRTTAAAGDSGRKGPCDWLRCSPRDRSITQVSSAGIHSADRLRKMRLTREKE